VSAVEWAETPAGVWRSTDGWRGPPDMVKVFADELPERREACRRYYETHGLVDDAGRFTQRAEDVAVITAEHRRHMQGSDWSPLLTDGEVAERLRRMRASQAARQVAARARPSGPLDRPAVYAEAQQRMAEAELSGPLRGVPRNDW
jgi:hypothetical protein